uniref:(northern house mosquito) hypothetical protein n=1 Tax=Culex pipiens TaxID=7175 RepID=A0A8D8AS71_CULPI
MCRHGRTAAEHGDQVPDAGSDQDYVTARDRPEEGDGDFDPRQQATQEPEPGPAAVGAAVGAVPEGQFVVFDQLCHHLHHDGISPVDGRGADGAGAVADELRGGQAGTASGQNPNVGPSPAGRNQDSRKSGQSLGTARALRQAPHQDAIPVDSDGRSATPVRNNPGR